MKQAKIRYVTLVINDNVRIVRCLTVNNRDGKDVKSECVSTVQVSACAGLSKLRPSCLQKIVALRVFPPPFKEYLYACLFRQLFDKITLD